MSRTSSIETRDRALPDEPTLRAICGGLHQAGSADDRPRLKIALIGINHFPETTGIAPYTTGLARGLAIRGHDVEVMTGQPHYPQWQRLPGYRRFRTTERIDGVRVRRFRHYVPRRQSTLRRALMEFTFGVQAALSRWHKPDVVICVSPPLVASAMCTARARVGQKGPAVGVLVQDVYSRAITEIGATHGASSTAIRRLEAFLTHSADGVVVIHEGFGRDLANLLYVDLRHIREIRNWTHVPFPSAVASAEFRARHGWRPEDIVVLHAGNMGLKQGLDNVIEAARLAGSATSPVKYVLLGDGHQRRRLELAARGVSNLEILDPVSESEFPAALGAADVLLVNELPGVAHMAMPSKLTSYFQAGKPVLAASDEGGFTAREIALSGAGVRVPAGRPDLLHAAALRLGGDREVAAQMGAAGRRYSDEVLSAGAALDRYEQWVFDLAGSRVAAARGTA